MLPISLLFISEVFICFRIFTNLILFALQLNWFCVQRFEFFCQNFHHFRFSFLTLLLYLIFYLVRFQKLDVFSIDPRLNLFDLLVAVSHEMIVNVLEVLVRLRKVSRCFYQELDKWLRLQNMLHL